MPGFSAWRRLLMWQRMDIMVVVMAAGWVIVISVWAPLGLLLVLGAGAYFVGVFTKLQDNSIDRARGKRPNPWQ